ncbi:glycosyltransferase family 87 protein [Limnoglobus roseus]|uniref:DUF2029 domain-containing protein n=1 Tax=Limnoglobus roseus TaxID=2598579 RepID=A0A5C1A7G2_9BACT|nr:glycosyltransferase family 87 protein [Limnoglobus roseus]QEL13926.1 hypothetical protein PX52LOC_00786 [Limnoglobus roseus]
MPNLDPASNTLSLLRRLPRWAVVVWIVLLVGVIGRVAKASPLSGTVVPIYLTAGERWLHGEDIYAPAPPHDVYRNPPGVAAFFAPLSLLPPKTAAILWRLFGVALYVTGLLKLLRQAPVEAATSRQLGLLAFLAALLIIPSFNNGQVNVAIIGSLLHATADFRRGHLWRAAAWIAFASFFKIYPLALGLLFCVVAPRFLVRLVPTIVVAALLPFACQQSDYVAAMHNRLVEFLELEGHFRAILTRAPWDWTIIARVWFDVQISKDTSQLVSAAAGLTFAVVVGFARWRRPEAAIGTAFSLGCIWMTLFGPATENSTYTLLAPAAALLMLNRPWYRQPVGLAAATLLALPILRGLFPSSEVMPLRTAQPFAAILLLGLTVSDVLRSRRPVEMQEAQALLRPGFPSITSREAGGV